MPRPGPRSFCPCSWLETPSLPDQYSWRRGRDAVNSVIVAGLGEWWMASLVKCLYRGKHPPTGFSSAEDLGAGTLTMEHMWNHALFLHHFDIQSGAEGQSIPRGQALRTAWTGTKPQVPPTQKAATEPCAACPCSTRCTGAPVSRQPEGQKTSAWLVGSSWGKDLG